MGRAKGVEALAAEAAAAAPGYREHSDGELLKAFTEARLAMADSREGQRFLPDAVCLIREAAWRGADCMVTESQLLTALKVYDGGVVAELPDGEGKGIAAIVAACLAVLAGRQVHVITLDTALARRDFSRARQVCSYLGITTHLLGDPGMDSQADGRAGSEVTYGSYPQFAFGYLDDCLSGAGQEIKHDGDHVLAIVDEADTILLDKATSVFQVLAPEEGHDESRRYVHRHDHPARASETVPAEGKVLAECSTRGYFTGYGVLSGLTATAMPAAARFRRLYGLEIGVVPGAHQRTRKDHDDLWYAGSERMLADLEMQIVKHSGGGRPVLVRVLSAETGNEISERLNRRHVRHAVLRPDDSPSAVMARAGRAGAVTILVGEAGRGYSASFDGTGDGLLVLGVFQSGSRCADDWVRGLAGQRGQPGSAQFLHSSEEYSIVRKKGSMTQAETRGNKPPMAVDKSLRGRFLRNVINGVYRSSEAAELALQAEFSESDDLAWRLHTKAYALRNSIISGIDADELGRWAAELGAASIGMSAAQAGTACEKRERELGAIPAGDFLTAAALSAFDCIWSDFLARCHELEEAAAPGASRSRRNRTLVISHIEDSFAEACKDIKRAVIATATGVLYENPDRESAKFHGE